MTWCKRSSIQQALQLELVDAVEGTVNTLKRPCQFHAHLAGYDRDSSFLAWQMG